MRLMLTSHVPDGVPLGRDLWKANTKIPWLRAGTPITARYKEAMVSAGLSAVYIEDEFSEGIEIRGPVREDVRRKAAETIDTALTEMRGVAKQGERIFQPSFVGDIAGVAMALAQEIEMRGDEAGLAFGDLATADAYTFQHSVDVATMGMVIAHRMFTRRGWIDAEGKRRLDRVEERLVRIGLGLLLHDIGKLAIPEEILNKPGKLEPEEWEIMRQHPVTGVEMLAKSRVSPLVSVVVRAHHERWDGTGYPDGRKGADIHQFARIAAVADVFDAITSERPYKRALPNSKGVEIIREGRGTAFDPECVDVFLEIVAPFPPGTMVDLSDGRRGVVVETPDGALDRPVVRLLPDPAAPRAERVEIALTAHPELTVSEIAEREPVAV